MQLHVRNFFPWWIVVEPLQSWGSLSDQTRQLRQTPTACSSDQVKWILCVKFISLTRPALIRLFLFVAVLFWLPGCGILVSPPAPPAVEVLCCAVLGRSVMSDSVTLWPVALQAPLSVGILQARILERKCRVPIQTISTREPHSFAWWNGKLHPLKAGLCIAAFSCHTSIRCDVPKHGVRDTQGHLLSLA